MHSLLFSLPGSCIPLHNFRHGIIATGPDKNKYIAGAKLSEQYKPLIEGKNIKRYKILFANKYILYDRNKLYRAREEHIFLSPEKLITQRIGGGKYPLVVAYDNQKFYTFNSTNTILRKNNSALNLKYLLALMNSKLLNYYFKVQFTNKSELTVNISKTFLEQLPIKGCHGESCVKGCRNQAGRKASCAYFGKLI